jgi:transketolase
MASVAAGMALEGKKVFVYSIANFPTFRCLEQIRNDICYHNADVKIVSVGAGFAYGSQGMSHHATEDIAIMRALPQMAIYSPCDAFEVTAAVKAAYERNGPCYIRLGKGGEPDLHESALTGCGKAHMLRKGNDTAILATGAITAEAIAASILLEKQGISCAVYSFPMIKPIDEDTVKNLMPQYKFIFTLEEGNITGGFGSAVSEIAAEYPQCKPILARFGVRDTFTEEVGSQEYLRSYYRIGANDIKNEITRRLANG